MSALRASGLSKSFGAHRVLAGLDLAVPSGSLTAIIGASGSGKTTLLRILAGFERADAGTLAIGEVIVEGPRFVPAQRRGIGYVPQEGALFPHLDVAGNVGFGLARAIRRSSRVAELLELVGLTGLAGRYPNQLSGGQQQRVALARALAIEPEAVLLDEPFAALDAALRATVRADVAQVLRTAGTTTLLVTHDQDEALSFADQVAVLRDGRIAQLAPPAEVYRQPVDPGVASFVGQANLLDATVRAGAADCVLGRVELRGQLPEGSQITLLLRPEQLALAPGGPARISDRAYYGHDAVHRVRLPAGGEVIVRTDGADLLPIGSPVTVAVRGPGLAWPREP